MSDRQPITEADIQAFADRRVSSERAGEIEAWLASRPEDAERVAVYRQLTADIRATYDGLLSEPIPDGLRRSAIRNPRWRRFALAAAWLIAGAALGAMAGWQLHALRSGAPALADSAAVMARRAAVAHVTYSPEVRHPVEVGADQEQHLVTWLSKRVGVKVEAPKLEAAGMSLVGGRLLPGENGPVAQFMYQNQAGRRLTLYVRAEVKQNRETAFRYSRENNVSVFYWIDRERGYAIASSDLDKEELLRIATMVYKQLESS